jgi:hypothetical protein
MIDPVPKKVVEDLLAGLKEIAGLLVGPLDQERVTKAWCLAIQLRQDAEQATMTPEEHTAFVRNLYAWLGFEHHSFEDG